AAVRKMFEDLDVFIFTLGLTEAWRSKIDGTIYPIAPGVIAGEFHESRYEFVNFTSKEVRQHIVKLIQLLRSKRKKKIFKILFTVSPVPLTATASGKHALVATNYSKACLNTVARELAEERPFIDYFPSFDIVTNPAAHSDFYEANLRSITDSGVDNVMKIFLDSYGLSHSNGAVPVNDYAKSTNNQKLADAQVVDRDDELQCEEALLEAFG
ncbi:MAG: GSCFA domain-containing protein, partial [Proteobacteria bacterium]|nr:GSCFA domain-containing protein [Pseudomonadota bacterium]